MNRWPYSKQPLQAFDEMERDALALNRMAEEREAAAEAIEKMINGSPEAIRQHRLTAKRLRRVVAALGYVSGRVDRLHLLDERLNFEDTFHKRAS